MAKPVLHVSLEPARGLPADEVSPLELVERAVDVLGPGDRLEDASPERAPDDRRGQTSARSDDGSASTRASIAAVIVTGRL